MMKKTKIKKMMKFQESPPLKDQSKQILKFQSKMRVMFLNKKKMMTKFLKRPRRQQGSLRRM